MDKRAMPLDILTIGEAVTEISTDLILLRFSLTRCIMHDTIFY